jgi:hypothetical protein
MRLAAAMLLACFLSAAALAAGLKITIFTNPKSYLAKFPLGVAQSELYEQLGAPESTLQLGERTVWVYRYGEGYGLRKFSFELVGGKVVEVRYNDQGPWNGLTATQLQAKH